MVLPYVLSTTYIATVVWFPPPADNNLLRKHDRTKQHVTGKWGRGGGLSVCLLTLNLHPSLTTTYAALHSDDCYFGIMSICTALNWGAVKSHLNTALSYHAILASVSIVEWVQIRCTAMDMLDNHCSFTSWLVSSFCLDPFFFQLFIHPLSQPLKHAKPHLKNIFSLTSRCLAMQIVLVLIIMVLRWTSIRFQKMTLKLK